MMEIELKHIFLSQMGEYTQSAELELRHKYLFKSKSNKQ